MTKGVGEIKPASCRFCGKEFPSYMSGKRSLGRWSVFCSRSCYQSHRVEQKTKNLLLPKKPQKRINGRRVRAICKCGGSIYGHKNVECRSCYKKRMRDDALSRKISDVSGIGIYKDRHSYQIIRSWAKILMDESGAKKECCVCGYSAHVEVCHRRPISSFPKNTILGDVNDLSNMVYLCPNHHWEFDAGLISV